MQLTNPFIELGIEQGIRQGIQRGIRQGIQKGVRKGRHQGEVELVLRQLTRRLGPLSRSQRSSIRKLDLAQVEALGEALLEFNSRATLSRWLEENPG